MGGKFPICLQQKLSSSAAWPKYLINASWECGAGRRKQVAHLYLGLKKFSKEFSTFGFVSGTQKVLKRVLNILCFYLGLKNFQRVVNSLCLYLRHKKFSKGFSHYWWRCNWDLTISKGILIGDLRVFQGIIGIFVTSGAKTCSIKYVQIGWSMMDDDTW